LHGEIERAHRLITDNEPWPTNHCAGDRDPLALPARELARIAGRSIGRHADLLENVTNALANLLAPNAAIAQQRLGQGLADRARRIERAVWVLEDHLNVAPEVAAARARSVRDVLAVERDPSARRDDLPEDRLADRRFAGAGFADEA
jgi:hypothetical protein